MREGFWLSSSRRSFGECRFGLDSPRIPLVGFFRIKFVNQRRCVGNEIRRFRTVDISEGGRSVPSDNRLFSIGSEVQRQHLFVELFSTGNFVTSLGMGHREGVGDLELAFWFWLGVGATSLWENLAVGLTERLLGGAMSSVG